MPLNAHRLIAKTAAEMAEAMFEVYARDNDTYKRLRADGQITEKEARRLFVMRVAPKLYEDARQTLVAMLAKPDDEVCVAMKDEIAEALIADNALRAHRKVAAQHAKVPKHLH